ncbi:uncharacterized protein LOC131428493 [Malaya genurostris]|uniref:uncharacterized protein LOC131428493 n=1 Tax=Malaya genurostris TaxID=325434 RepID=UPI0026F398EA|nr:uncharacterized protein LOC131428493 [Malaya genurostris]
MQSLENMEIDIGKVEPTWDEDTLVDDSSIASQVIGPENGSIQCQFKAAKREFVGQRIYTERLPDWLVRANSMESFRLNLWSLVEPYIKQPILVETDESGHTVATWGVPKMPTVSDAGRFVTFVDKRNRKSYSWCHLRQNTIDRWINASIVVCIHVYSTAMSSRNVYEIARDTLLSPKKIKHPVISKQQRRVFPESADGYSFRDEVRALRETFLQMRDLMHVLDNRIMLLEEKCDQTVPHEPMIQMSAGECSDGVESVGMKAFLNSDPLLVHTNIEIKEETSEEEIEALDEHYE